jgi:peptide/nickel transport system permease protein
MAGTVVVSLVVGVTAAMVGGILDLVLMRIVDVFLAIPSIVLALAIVGVLGPGFGNLLIALVASSWAHDARLCRSFALHIRSQGYIHAARMAGYRWDQIIVMHVIPQVFPQILVVATLQLGGVVSSFAGFSFLGLGAQPPQAEWGTMLSESRAFFLRAPWLLIAPSCTIFAAVTAANLIGDAVRDASGSGAPR